MSDFEDLLIDNRRFVQDYGLTGYDGLAHAGIAVVTCMDSRIDPLGMIGLEPGDAKIFRNPGGRVTEAALEAILLGVHLLRVTRVLIVAHTECTVASGTETELRRRLAESVGFDTPWFPCHVIEDQTQALSMDVAKVRSHPLIPDTIHIGGFMYDVDTGLLTQKVRSWLTLHHRGRAQVVAHSTVRPAADLVGRVERITIPGARHDPSHGSFDGTTLAHGPSCLGEASCSCER